MAKESDQEPGLIALALQGVKLVGVRGALRIATYGLWKARLDKRYLKDRPTGPELRPGSKGEIELGGDLTRIRDEIVSATSARIPFGELSLEVVFLNLAMVRLTWTPGRLPVSSAHDDTTPTEVQPFEASEDGDTTVLESGVTRVRVARDGSVVIDARPLVETAEEAAAGGWRDDWRPIRRERPPVLVGETWTATVELEPDDQVHGLGERAAPLNLRPGIYGLWNTEQSGSYGPEADPLYITIPSVTDLVRHTGRRVTRCIDHLTVDSADFEVFTILEQMIEFRPVARYIERIENGPKDLLHVLDMLSDRDRGAGFQFYVRRTRQMIGVRVSFQDLFDFDTELL